jgi:hypothetical protein
MYSLIRPLRTGFRRIWRAWKCPAVMQGGWCSASGTLADSQVRAGGVVALLILGQDGEQMRGAENQHPVQQFAAQRADESLAGRVHPRSLNSGAQDRDASGLEDRIERGREVRTAVADPEPEVLKPLIQIQGQIADLWGPRTRPLVLTWASMRPARIR